MIITIKTLALDSESVESWGSCNLWDAQNLPLVLKDFKTYPHFLQYSKSSVINKAKISAASQTHPNVSALSCELVQILQLSAVFLHIDHLTLGLAGLNQDSVTNLRIIRLPVTYM